MLLDYSIDTNENVIENDKAISLRKRIAGRHLQTAVQNGIVSDKTLIKLKDANKREIRAHGRDEILPISLAKVNDQIIVSRTGHQLHLEGYLRKLERDVSRASTLSKSHIDTLTDLEKRINSMRFQLNQPSVPTVDEDIRKQVNVHNHVKLDSLFTDCSICQRKILCQLFEKHHEVCKRKKKSINPLTRPVSSSSLNTSLEEESKPIYDYDQDVVTSLSTFKPQPPRSFKVLNIGSTFIDWRWEPPIVDGGLAITDYEISYSLMYMEMNHDTDKYVKFVKECDPIRTSNFCLINPICHSGYKIVGLRAQTEYYDFKIRSVNLRGFSEWIPMADGVKGKSIKTYDPEAPSNPLFFRCEHITSTCLHLAWDVPYYDGGLEIIDYIITCTASEVHNTVTARDVIIPKAIKVTTGPCLLGETSFILRNIMPDIDVVHIQIKAVNKAGLISEPKNLGINCHTNVCSRFGGLVREIDRANIWPQKFIDSSFLSNVQQRLLKVDYIKTLEYELSHTIPDALEEREQMEWAAMKIENEKQRQAKEIVLKEKALRDSLFDREDFHDGSDDKIIHGFQFNFQQRREHYKRKVKKLEAVVEILKSEREAIDVQRTRLTSIMTSKQRRQLELKIERDRVVGYHGDIVTSNVIHGHSMQYSVKDFNAEIYKASEACQKVVAETKYKVMDGERRKVEIKSELARCEEKLKERRAAYLGFSLEHQKAQKVMSRLHTNRSDEWIMNFYFKELVEYTESRKSMRKRAAGVFDKMIERFKLTAFTKWRYGHFNRSSSEVDDFSSLGGLLLQKAYEKRRELQSDLRHAIAVTTNIDVGLEYSNMAKDMRDRLESCGEVKNMRVGQDHEKMSINGMHFIYEGDGYAMVGQFNLARSMYESQIMFLRSRPAVDIKLLAICHGRLGKMFLKEGKNDRAIIDFDRQLSLAKEIDDKVETADAYYGIGEGYLRVRDYENAIRYLDLAQVRLIAIGHVPKFCGALRALRECYSRLHKKEAVDSFTEKIEKFENEVRLKLTIIETKLDDMKSRLVTTTAGILNIVKMERTTLKALELRQFIEANSKEQDKVEIELENQSTACLKLEKILQNIQLELDEAFATDELEMLSYLVHDQPQIVDVEVLKNRLHARRIVELENYKVAKAEEKRIDISLKNLEDKLTDADQQLDIENGALMTHIRHDKPFRCVAFPEANAAGNEVTGTATGGTENFICAEGHNIHIIDYHSGELLHVFQGDDRRRIGEKQGHTAVVTCLLHDGDIIFSGGADENVMSWNMGTRKRIHVMSGHEGSIVSLASDGKFLVSGSADTTMRLWNKHTGVLLRVIYGHSKSVLSIQLGPTWMLTGSADEEVRIWNVIHPSNPHHAPKIISRQRLIGHEVSVTCVRYGNMEVMSGDVLGRIFIWWTESGEILRQIQVHAGPVKSMQFDAIHIVSGSSDCVAAITDIATGEVLQGLRGHQGHVLAVAFDAERIISAGGDNTLRYWQWGKKLTAQDKFHILDVAQTLLDVSKMYGTQVSDLMVWNGIIEPRHCYPGMKLIVRKGDPSKPTDAERVALEKARRKEVGIALTTKKLQNDNFNYKKKKVNRVHHLVTDMDYYSMGNRMFKKEKLDNDLFPERFDAEEKTYSMASRMKGNGSPSKMFKNSSLAMVRYFMTKDNDDEWGQIADAVALAMLSVFVEFEAYDIVINMKKQERDTKSVLGRIFQYQNKLLVEGVVENVIEESNNVVNNDNDNSELADISNHVS